MTTPLRLLLALALSAAASLVGLLAAATPAHAVDYYRYWSYFQVQDGAYRAADQGVGAVRPADGSVQAFRYAASAETSPNLPRIDLASATFAAVCGDEDADGGEKRVAVLVDYGVEQDADGQAIPEAEAECAEVPRNATTLQVLQEVTDGQVRTQTSSFGPLLCGIEGYPATGCADQTTTTATPADSGFVPVELDGATAAASPSASAGGSASASPSDLPQGTGQNNDQDTEQGRDANPFAYLGLGVVLFVILGAGVYLVRKRRSGA